MSRYSSQPTEPSLADWQGARAETGSVQSHKQSPELHYTVAGKELLRITGWNLETRMEIR